MHMMLYRNVGKKYFFLSNCTSIGGHTLKPEHGELDCRKKALEIED